MSSAEDLEAFSDLLDVAVANLQEAEKYNELCDGSLDIELQRKLSKELLVEYHRWLCMKKDKSECVEALNEWVLQESKFATEASETIDGVSKNTDKSKEQPGTMFTFHSQYLQCVSAAEVW